MNNTPPASRRKFFRTSAGMGAILAAASTGASGASARAHAAVRVRNGFVADPSTY